MQTADLSQYITRDFIQIQDQLRDYRNLLRRQGRLVVFIERLDHSTDTSDHLDQVLTDVGFSGIDVESQIYLNGTENASTVVISTALSLPEQSHPAVHVLYD